MFTVHLGAAMTIKARPTVFDPRKEPVPKGWEIGAECGIPHVARRNHIYGPDGAHHVVEWSDNRSPTLMDVLVSPDVPPPAS